MGHVVLKEVDRIATPQGVFLVYWDYNVDLYQVVNMRHNISSTTKTKEEAFAWVEGARILQEHLDDMEQSA